MRSPCGKKTLARLRADRAGNFTTMTALVAPLGIVLGALAVDAGSLYYERREAQALTDLAAITAAAHIEIAEKAAAATLQDNGIGRILLTGRDGTEEINAIATSDPVSVIVTPGRYEARLETAVSERFAAGTEPYNAVKITLRKAGTLYFGKSLIEAPTIGTSAIASAQAEAAFSVGSRLLSLDGGLLNAVLGSLTGSNISLSVMDYEALADADISAFSFIEALATELDLTAGTYSDVLESQATVGQIAAALASVSGTDRTASLAAKAFGQDTASARAKIDIGKLIDLGNAAGLPIGHPPSGLGASVSALDILGATAALANGTNQVKVDLGATIPGLLSATIDLAIGESPQSSPWFTIGETGDVVRTAQTRLKIVVEVGGSGGLLGTSIKLPLYVELAYAEARLTDIDCTGTRRVTVSARPGVVELRIAEVGSLTDFRTDPSFAPAKIVKAPLITVTGSARIAMTNMSSSTLTFSQNDIDKGTIKSVSTRNFTESLTKSLLEDLQLEVKIGGLGLGLPSAITGTVGTLLGAVTPAVDKLLYGLLEALGVKLGEADVRVTGLSCGRSVLVQ